MLLQLHLLVFFSKQILLSVFEQVARAFAIKDIMPLYLTRIVYNLPFSHT